ncbi:MAG: Mur ligase family protein [Bacteriovoracaceae bacterium]
MLNENDLSKILKVSLPKLVIEDIEWKVQDSKATSLLFYKIGTDSKSIDLFQDRISQFPFAWLVVNRAIPNLPKNCSVIHENDWPRIQKELLDLIYPLPNIKIFALTGTNGKTTTTDLVLQLGTLAGKKGLSIGTLGVREYQKTLLDFGQTSPGLIDLRKFLNRFGQDKDFCVLEASSHALIQERLYGLKFDSAGWLSFSQDHLDYHQTMDEYFQAKTLIFNYLKADSKLFVPHEQKELFQRLSELYASKVTTAPLIHDPLPLFFKVRFNKNNLEVARAIIESAYQVNSFDYEKLIPPEGRFYVRPYRSNFIVVDFAHTPDALDNICQAIRESFPKHKVKVLFGCGGDRDRTKRPQMGQVVDHWADEIYVTSDNPRSEDPDQIIDDILRGIKSHSVVRIVERPDAVKEAFKQLTENEILLLAGKGHEDYILKHGIKYPYSDIREVDNFLSGK